jgi:hypothetical protein
MNNSFKKVKDELENFKSLKENWDGYNGVIPDESLVDYCQEFVEKLESFDISPPKTMLTGSGELGLYWKTKTKYIEIDFSNIGYFSYFVETESNVAGQDDCTIKDFPKKLYEEII